MEPEQAGDEVRTELGEIRLRIQQLLERRLVFPLSQEEQDEYGRLGERELEALHILAGSPTSTPTSRDDGGTPPG